MEYDHIGLVTNEKRESEIWVESLRVWITDAKKHPFGVEWLRFEPDSPAPKELQERAHVSFKVKDLEEAAKGYKVLIAPFDVDDTLRVAFYELDDGSVVELMQSLQG